MKIDVRSPSLVITGAWNPVIFQPGWIASNLLDIPQGTQVHSAVVKLGPPPKDIIYIGSAGLSVTNTRLEFYLNSFADDEQAAGENLALKVLEVLPHTPIDALGVNFVLVEENPEPELLDLLQTTDDMREKYKILYQELQTSIEIFDGCTLNFTRKPSGDKVIFDLNFHYDHLKERNVQDTITGSINNCFGITKELLSSVYNLEVQDEYITYPIQEPAEIHQNEP